jgi:hypothetical protein
LRVKLLIAVLAVALIGLIAWQVVREDEPRYQGKPLSYWLEGYVPVPAPLPAAAPKAGNSRFSFLSMPSVAPSPSAELEANADKALHHVGTNALPTLLRMLRARDSALTLKLLELARKQHFISIKHRSAARSNTIACRALERLGVEAKGAVPALIEVYDRDLVIFSRTASPDASVVVGVLAIPGVLGTMGPEARSAIPSLLRGATNASANVRWVALDGLGNIHAEPETVVPVLIKALQDPDPLVRYRTARALARFGQDAQPGIPALVKLLDDPDQWARNGGLNALRDIHLNPEVAVPALAKALESTNRHFAFEVAQALEAYGAAARPATPALIEYFKREENPNLRVTIRYIIEQLDPEAAAKAGIR